MAKLPRHRAAAGRDVSVSIVVLGAASLALASSARGSPALPGFTGILNTPTAFSQAFQSGAAGMTSLDSGSRAYVNYGAWETGELTVSSSSTDVRVHAKYTFQPESPRHAALAVGGTSLLGGDRSLYAVAGANLRVRQGGSRVRVSGGVATHGSLSPLFGGVEFRVSRIAVLQSEWSGAMNFGVRVHPTAQFRIQAGVVRHRAAFGLSYDVGL